MIEHTCDCGQQYRELAGVWACQERRHAGSAELEEAAALSDLSSEERAEAEETRLRARAHYRVNPEASEEETT